jgi:hypothetical protein
MQNHPVDFREFHDKVYRHRQHIYSLELDGWEVPVLHGLVALAARHPEMAKLGQPTHQVIHEVRNWCLEVMRGWGFTPAQLKFLDEADAPAPVEGTDVRD